MCYRLAEAARSREASTEHGLGLHAPRESNESNGVHAGRAKSPEMLSCNSKKALVCGRGCTLFNRLSKCLLQRLQPPPHALCKRYNAAAVLLSK